MSSLAYDLYGAVSAAIPNNGEWHQLSSLVRNIDGAFQCAELLVRRFPGEASMARGMDDVERFDPCLIPESDDNMIQSITSDMETATFGEYVRYADYVALQKQLAEAREALKAAEGASGGVDAAHIANEWADMATNGVQWLRNIRDGISTADDALAEMESNYRRIIAISATPSPTSARELPELPECKHDAYLGACVHCGAGIRSGHVVSAPPLRGVNIFHPYYEAGFNAGREFEMAQQILADEITKDLSSCMAMVERSPSGSVMYPSPDFHEAAAKFLITHGDSLARRGGS